MSETIIEVVSGVAGPSLYVNDYRIAGEKPWGGGRTTHSWKFMKSRVPGLIKDIETGLGINFTQLQIIQAAKEEYVAWEARNAARTEYREFIKKYTDETGHWIDPDGEEDDIGSLAKYNKLVATKKAAQKELTSKRAKHRRLVKSLFKEDTDESE